MALIRNHSVALYTQVAARLRDEIAAGRHASGRLPSEKELIDRFDVSRVTIRQALQSLIDEGLVVSRQGRGTFIVPKAHKHPLGTLEGFFDVLVRQGLQPRTELVGYELAIAPADVDVLLEAHGAPVPYLERAYFIEGKPFAFVQGWLTLRAATVKRSDIKRQPIYGVLQHLLHITIARADVAVRAARPPRDVASRLDLGSAAALVMERSSYDEAGLCVEHSVFHIRPENYAFSLGVRGPLPIGSAITTSAGGTQQSIGHRRRPPGRSRS